MGRIHVFLSVLFSSSVVALPFTEDTSNEYEIFTEPETVGSSQSLERATTYNKPMLPLQFWEKVKKKPRGKHLKTSRLVRKMGDDFNANWMSIERPVGGTYNVKLSLPDNTVAELMEQVSDLDIENDIREMLGEGEEHRHEPTVSRAVGAFQQWLVKKSSCPVQFQWTDLGEYFWPRYVRQGECHGGSTAAGAGHHLLRGGGKETVNSCSWPRGMACNPADAQLLQILRWHCSRKKMPDLLGLTVRQKIRKTYKCRWIKVPYPVTSSCRCE